MKRRFILSLGALIILGLSSAYGSANELKAVKDSSFISYHVYHLFHSVTGIGKNILCRLETDSLTQKIRSVSVEAAVKAFYSGNEARDEAAMEAIESDKYPMVTFKSDSIYYNSDTTADVNGKVTFHGATKEIVILVSVTSRTNETICDGSFRLNFDTFKVDRPSLIFIPIANTMVIRFHMVFDNKL